MAPDPPAGGSAASPEITQVLEVLASQMSRGEVILFTGAGFSLGAKATDGEAVPSARGLKQLLWPTAFPGEPFDEQSQLGDVFEVARQSNRSVLRDTLRRCLTIDSESLPDAYKLWFEMPWHRIYGSTDAPVGR